MKRILLLAVATASALTGCATPNAGTSSEPIVEREYRTGSNIAVKRSPAADGVTTLSKEDVDRMRDSSLNSGAQMPAPRPGGSH